MISNASPIIFLAKISRLYLLKKLFGKITIPLAVKKEILVENKIETKVIEKAIDEGEIYIKEPRDKLMLGIGRGEDDAISLAVENKEPLIIDDAIAIEAARSLKVEIFRTTTIILISVKKKLIKKDDAIKLINRLIEEGYYISTKHYAVILEELKK